MMTKQGGATLVATMIKKYGSYEAYKQSMRERASKGGQNGNKKLNPNYTGGFAQRKICNCNLLMKPHTKPQCAGKKGGKNRWAAMKGDA